MTRTFSSVARIGRLTAVLVAVGALTGGIISAPAQAAHSAARPGWLAPDATLVELKDISQLPGATGTVGQQAVTPQTVYYFKAVKNHSGLQCLDGDTSTIGTNGAKVQLWSCNEWLNQMWYHTPVPGRSGYYTIRNARGNQCLDGDLNTIRNNGAKVHLWTCNGRDNQMWKPFCTNHCRIDIGLPPPMWTFQNAHGLKCLDGDTNTIGNNGAKVQLWTCNGWNNQYWHQVFDHTVP